MIGEIAAAAPDFEQLQERYDAIAQRLESACDAAQALEAFRSWDSLRREYATWASLAELRFQQDTRNPQYKADAERLNRLRPKINGLDVALKRKFLASPLRSQLEKDIGPYAFERWQFDVTAYDPVIEPLMVQESALNDRYTALLAGARIELRGETLNLPGIGKYAEHPERQARRDAAFARWGFFFEHREELDSLYGELVELRTRMARELEFRNFIELGYRRMMRTDYGPAQIAQYREDIAREIVPLARRIARQQAQDLGLDELMVWDEHVFNAAEPPKPPSDYDRMLAAARGVFEELGSDVRDFAAMMVRRNLLDLQSREGKAGGGFCTSFPAYGVPFIFANFNGTTHDVNVLLHEMGHAFQVYSSAGMPVADYLWPTLEACEVHSMSMEFLSWPHLERFFGEDAQRYRIQHLKTSLMFLPYGAAIDHFQHFVYENPQATPRERNAFWKQLEATYLPWRRYGGIPHLEQGGYWQTQRHVYVMPFYYIDYSLALCCALQFLVRSQADYPAALEEYTRLCKRGGQMPFQSLVRSAGLRSPFDSGVLAFVAERAAAIIGL
jgi:M3 family oligoendopeptidase